jgi:autotransporter passenger strand-loop-strand repeat protein
MSTVTVAGQDGTRSALAGGLALAENDPGPDANNSAIATSGGFSGLMLQVALPGIVVLDATFNSVAQANAYFTDHLLSQRTVPNTATNPLEITVSLPETLPEFTAPASESLNAGQTKLISGVKLAETGHTPDETFTVSVSDTYGLLSTTGPGVTGSGTTSLTLTGSLAQVNADLKTLTDTSFAAYPPDSITLAATDSFGAQANPAAIAVTVNGAIGFGDIFIVPKGQTATYLTVSNYGAVLVKSAGAANHDVLNSGGLQGILSGGTADGTMINNGGIQGVLGSAVNTQIYSGGTEIVGPGGDSAFAVIRQGGLEFVLAGGLAAFTTIEAGGTLVLSNGAQTFGLDFFGSNATLSIGGPTLPTPPSFISGFDQHGFTDDQIVLTGFTYVAGHDTAILGAGNVLTLDLNGTTERLYFDPSENYAGQSFSITTNSLDQVVVVDPTIGMSSRQMGFLSLPAAASPSLNNPVLLNIADLFADIRDAKSAASFLPSIPGLAGIAAFENQVRGPASMGLFNLFAQHGTIIPLSHSG